jgi:hypothetical protein
MVVLYVYTTAMCVVNAGISHLTELNATAHRQLMAYYTWFMETEQKKILIVTATSKDIAMEYQRAVFALDSGWEIVKVMETQMLGQVGTPYHALSLKKFHLHKHDSIKQTVTEWCIKFFCIKKLCLTLHCIFYEWLPLSMLLNNLLYSNNN